MADLACPVCGRLNPEESAYCAHCGSPLAPAGQWYPTEERKVVTVLFVDLSDFSVLGGTLDPETTRTIVARFFAAAREEIRRFGGSVEKFIGDAVMAVFGLPAAHEDDPTRAIEAALAIRRRLETLNETFRTEFGVAVSIHVGINTGEVLAAAGPAEGRDFLITGDAVNVAARLHELARPNQILIGERTYRFGRRVFDFRPAGALSMKGRDQPLAAWEVVGPRPPTAARVGAKLVGRTEELTRLRAIYAGTVDSRRPHIIVVTGHPGIGKSRLVAEFREGLAGADPSPLFRSGRCLPRGEAITYLPLAEILKQESGITDADSPGATRAKIAAAVAAAGAEGLADALAYTIGVDIPGSPVALLDPRAVGQELVRAWRGFFEAKARARPLVVIFEDIHWAGDPLLELIEAVTSGVADAPLLVLGTARLDLIERRRRWGQSDNTRTVLRLDPLNRLDSEHLLENLLPPGLLSPPLRDTIIGRAEGNPFFIEEMVRMLADEGVIVQEEGRWRRGRTPGEITLPDTIQAVIAARIDHLPLAQKAVLQQAAVIGRTFWLGALRALAGDVDVGDAVEALERREFIQDGRQPTLPGEREYAFKHVLIHEVAYGSLPRGARGRLHQEVGQWLERAAGPRLSEAVDLLAHHFQQAATFTGSEEARRAAATYLRQAAESAYRRYALDQAATYARAALPFAEASAGPGLHELIGDIELVLGGTSEAETAYREALRAPLAPRQEARLRRKLAHTDLSQSAEELARARELLTLEPDAAEEAAILTLSGRQAHTRMNYEEAIATFTRARTMLDRDADRAVLAWCLMYICDTLYHLGRHGEVLSVGTDMRALAADLDNPLFKALADGLLGRAHFLRGGYVTGLQHVEAAVASARQAGNAEIIAWGLGLRGTVLARLGHLAEAARILREAVEAAEPFADAKIAQVGVYAVLGPVLAELGHLEEAAAALALAREVPEGANRPDLILRLDIAALQVDTLAGRPTDSVERCEATLRRWPASRLLQVQGLAAVGEAWAEAGRKERAGEVAEQCRTLAVEDGARYEALIAEKTLGRVSVILGDWTDALGRIRAAAEGFLGLGARLEWARCRAHLADALHQTGRTGEGRQVLQDALQVFEECGAAVDLARSQGLRDRLDANADVPGKAG